MIMRTSTDHHHHHDAAARTLKRRVASLFLAAAVGAVWMQAAVFFPISSSDRRSVGMMGISRSSSSNNKCHGKERLLEILDRAQENAVDDDEDKCHVSRLLANHRKRQQQQQDSISITASTKHEFGKTTCNIRDMCDQLPSWKQVTHLYGKDPVVLGTMETCSKLLADVAGQQQNVTVRVVGLYNSGTNAVAGALKDNFPDWKIVQEDKHVPLKYQDGGETNANNNVVLPVVVVRDPFRWMVSMCKTNYDVHWMRAPHQHCPNLVPSAGDWDTPLRKKVPTRTNFATYKVKVRAAEAKAEKQIKDDEYDSLADLWTEWYRPYIEADYETFPRLVVRFEDFLFHREHVVSQIAQCVTAASSSTTTTPAGTSGVQQHAPSPSLSKNNLKYRMASAKSHGRSSNLISAMINYGRTRGRYAGMAIEDLRYAAKALDSDLLNELHYLAVPEV